MNGNLFTVHILIQYLLISVTFGQAVPLGSNCSQPDACVDSNSVCSSGKCVCKPTHYDSNGVNTPDGTCTTKSPVGGTCPTPTVNVPYTATCIDSNARCRQSGNGYTCQCISTHYDTMVSTNRKCESRRSLGSACVNLTYNLDQCRDPSATCTSPSQSSTYTCTCNSGYHQESAGCVANKALGESCNAASVGECSDPVALCISGKCTCDTSHYDSNGQTLGGTCSPMTNLRVTNVGFTSIQTNRITVSWSAPDDYSLYISGYIVKWRPKDDNSINEQSKRLAFSDTTTQLSSGIDPGRAYTVTISSENDKTQENSVRSSSVSREQAAKPGITGGIDFSRSDLDASGGITVVWSSPSGYVSNYKVQLIDDGTVIATKKSTITSFSPSGLNNGYTYSIKIQANSKTFDSGKTVPGDTYTIYFKTTPKLPNPPTASTCNNPTDSSIKLSWSVPEKPNGDIIQYRIDVFKDGSNVKTENTKTNGTKFLVSGLAPGTQYTLRVYTENEVGVSVSYDSVVTGCKTRAKMSEKPRNLKLTGVTSRGFNISWTRPDNTYSQENYGYILQIKYNQDICKEEVFFKCSDCTGRFQLSSAADNLCTGIYQKTGMKTTAELKQEISYSADLGPDILYTVYVAATTDAGMGHPANISQLTLEEAPQQPEIVSVIDIEATSVTVTWNIADPRPGQTSYEIKLTADQPAVDKVVVVEGFNNRSVAVTGLQEYWNYQIKVTASTSKGSSASNEEATQTKPAAPGKVSNFKIIEAFGGIYTLIKINWQAPPILDRNGVIKYYSFVYNAEGKTATTQTLTHVSLEEHEYSVVVDVIPEDTYTFQVYASNQQNMRGEITTVVKKTPAGVPVNIENTLQVNVISSHKTVDKTPRKFTVTIVREFFEESTNGRIQATGLIACAESCDFSRIKTLLDFNTMSNWKQASQNGFTPYRVTYPTWLLDLQAQSCSTERKKRDITSLEYTLGSDDCEDTSSDEYCNGPLSPDIKFMLIAVSCTNGGCLLSKEYGPFSTAPAPESTERNCTTQSVVIGVVLGFIIVILLLYAGYTTLVIRRYRANKAITYECLNDDSEVHKVRKSDSKGPMYVNESFMVGVAEAAEGPNNPALNKDSETEYSRLDDNTRDEKATYDIIQAM